ncbi:hypothetical protein DFJ73DRAFT_838979 [Zopfochytrium polystomum]|nr:hypothetical protein DFJ73DRAFT_838979 [Zopfochytrium polystomum]
MNPIAANRSFSPPLDILVRPFGWASSSVFFSTPSTHPRSPAAAISQIPSSHQSRSSAAGSWRRDNDLADELQDDDRAAQSGLSIPADDAAVITTTEYDALIALALPASRAAWHAMLAAPTAPAFLAVLHAPPHRAPAIRFFWPDFTKKAWVHYLPPPDAAVMSVLVLVGGEVGAKGEEEEVTMTTVGAVVWGLRDGMRVLVDGIARCEARRIGEYQYRFDRVVQ